MYPSGTHMMAVCGYPEQEAIELVKKYAAESNYGPDDCKIIRLENCISLVLK